MKNGWLALVGLVALLGLISGALSQSSGNQCTGTPNLNPIYTDDPVLVKTVPNGKLYKMGNETVVPNVFLVQVWGTAYEMGYAHGQLLQAEIQSLYPQLFTWIESQIQEVLSFLPEFLQKIIAEEGTKAALDLTYMLTKPYIQDFFLEELKGIADGSGIDVQQIIQAHMLPELIKAHCSMFGAYGPATANTEAQGKLYQLRALDWSANGPFQEYPAVITYHPSSIEAGGPGGHPFSILAWSGFVGALTGMSSVDMGICEKVWLSYNESSSRSGIPWYFLLRDILQFDNNTQDALNRIYGAHRTCSIWVGIGDAKANGGNGTFDIVDYSLDELNVYNADNFPAYPPYHPKFDGVAFLDKHVQPSHNMCLGSLLSQYYGSLDPPTTIKYITSQHQTGNMHIGIFDYLNQYMYVSNAGVYTASNNSYVNAFDRPFVRVPVGQLWTEQPPSSN